MYIYAYSLYLTRCNLLFQVSDVATPRASWSMPVQLAWYNVSNLFIIIFYQIFLFANEIIASTINYNSTSYTFISCFSLEYLFIFKFYYAYADTKYNNDMTPETLLCLLMFIRPCMSLYPVTYPLCSIDTEQSKQKDSFYNCEMINQEIREISWKLILVWLFDKV